jgi:hypothetical protein
MLRTLALLFSCNLAFAQYGDLGELKILKPEDKQDAASTPAPKGAIVLFDGKNLDAWTKQDGKTAAHWKLVEGGAVQVEKGGNIFTKEKFGGSFHLHVEFRVPYMPEAKGQQRANSGIYLQGRYEVQVLDSYGLESKNNDCGAIYEIKAPAKNACKAPTVWQSYDIDFTAPVFDGKTKKEPTVISVTHNGVKIHDAVKVPVDNTRAGAGGDPMQPGPIMLQDHGNPVQFRNIWIEKK